MNAMLSKTRTLNQRFCLRGDALRWVALVPLVIVCAGCVTTPITGRRQLVLVPEDREIALGLTAYQEALASEQPSTNGEYVAMVQRVGQRLAAVADRPHYQWEFRVIASPQQNAFCLPGGKVAIYEGLMPICENEAGLAVVMSHEVAHALARHGGERMSHGYVVDSAGIALSHITKNQEAARRDQIRKVFGLTSEYGFVLPYSRKHELEADHMGLILMARAGYDPRAAPRFWQRFAQAQGGGNVGLSQYLSTHPADDRRAAELEQLLPEAIAIYQAAPYKYGAGLSIQVPQQMVTQARPRPAESFVLEPVAESGVQQAAAHLPIASPAAALRRPAVPPTGATLADPRGRPNPLR
jgi:predicted Zn-dependent protease